MGRVVSCGLKATGIVVSLLAIYDIFVTGVLLSLISTLLSPNPSAGMGLAFHVIYITLGILIATAVGSVIGLVWALFSTSSSVKNKTRVAVVWFVLLAFSGLAYISKSSIEMPQPASDLEDLQVTETGEGKLKISGRLKNNLYGVSRLESVEYQDQYGTAEIVVHVYAKAADGQRRPPTFSHSLNLPDHVKRILVGNGGDLELVWGLSEEKLLLEQETLHDKLTPVSLEYLWAPARAQPKDPSIKDWWEDWWLGLEARRIHLGRKEPEDGSLDPYKTKIDSDHRVYKDRISGKIKAMKFNFSDGSSIIIDEEPDSNLTTGTNLIICEPDGTMGLYRLKDSDESPPSPHSPT